MNFASLILGAPIFGAGAFALYWLVRRLPQGWRGIGLGFAAIGGVSLLSIGAWIFSLQLLETATHVCLDCGRVERQSRFGPICLWSELVDENAEYAPRFAPDLAPGHAHKWCVQGCIQRFGGVACTEFYCSGWFDVLPRLADRDAADALAREARALPWDRRRGLMSDFEYGVVFPSEFRGQGIDEAFATWRKQR